MENAIRSQNPGIGVKTFLVPPLNTPNYDRSEGRVSATPNMLLEYQHLEVVDVGNERLSLLKYSATDYLDEEGDDSARITVTAFFDPDTGFFVGETLQGYVQTGTFITDSKIQVIAKEIGSVPIPTKSIVEPKTCPEGYTRLGDYCKSPYADVMTVIVLVVIIATIAGVIFFLKKRKGGSKTQTMCSKCNTSVAANTKFCRKCGNPMAKTI